MTTPPPSSPLRHDGAQPAAPRSLAEVFSAFLTLGLTSFGGPIAHLGYFRDEFVVRRRWIDEAAYADLVALCQFLPGPASSQVGFSLGVLRGGGLSGGLAAWAGFTLPSALLLVAVASGASAAPGPLVAGLLHGLKLVAVAVVAQAVWGMARSLAPDRPRAGLALAALWLVVLAPGAAGQLGAIALGAAGGLALCRASGGPAGRSAAFPVSRRTAVAALAIFLALLVLPPGLAGLTGSRALAVFDAFYRSGALVFGGGHVVLPLLQATLVAPGFVTGDSFLAGYGAAQAVPGPLFTVAAFLGTVLQGPPSGVAGAALALVAIFLPGLLLVLGALPFWDALRARPLAQAAMRGTNAAVVGILAAALYDPVWTSAVGAPRDMAVAATAFGLLTVGRLPPWLVVLLTAAGGAALA
ncbi:chromate efflux transporter [Methylobacterium nodulans]|uniref:Chromate transporter, chromate ion transporter (CHR) family n=1 Tax=Methylobacterium nodulans (strain LMG 21967 / CNCM I-2342 / ORS 2060) TaxID=460265 RepID=B8IKT1_METNO|nr:chromate efflux transporter [Methylobacterium nodulans]ACL56288.1 chromate transporter, chromate ion transporter (CHR) family [Methylobacterium nodulans ORS 2060]